MGEVPLHLLRYAGFCPHAAPFPQHELAAVEQCDLFYWKIRNHTAPRRVIGSEE